MLKNTVLIKKALVLTSVLSAVGLACEGSMYIGLASKARVAELGGDATTSMVEVAHADYLLQQINAGNIGEAKAFLSSSLASNTKEIQSRVAFVDGATREMWSLQHGHIMAEVRKNPECYEASCRNAILETSDVIQVAQH